jgi:hypothetical protein
MTLREDRTLSKPSDDSGEAAPDRPAGAAAGRLTSGSTARRRGLPRGVQFCMRRSDFKGLSVLFCNSNQVHAGLTVGCVRLL